MLADAKKDVFFWSSGRSWQKKTPSAFLSFLRFFIRQFFCLITVIGYFDGSFVFFYTLDGQMMPKGPSSHGFSRNHDVLSQNYALCFFQKCQSISG